MSKKSIKRICVFCGSNSGLDPSYKLAAQSLGSALVDRSLELIYGGGNIGLMGAVADAVLDRGGHVTGVIPEFLVRKEVAHQRLTKLEIVDSMHTRKLRMAELADGFIALPGGFGTFEEIFEIITWAQLGLHQKPCGILNASGFFDHLSAFVDHTIAQGFVKEEQREVVLWSNDANGLLDKLSAWEPISTDKWIKDSTKA